MQYLRAAPRYTGAHIAVVVCLTALVVGGLLAVSVLLSSQPTFINDNARRAFEALQRLEATYWVILVQLTLSLVAVAALCYGWFVIRRGRSIR
jgi:hypothetical protein